jgi:hypothetical protein
VQDGAISGGCFANVLAYVSADVRGVFALSTAGVVLAAVLRMGPIGRSRAPVRPLQSLQPTILAGIIRRATVGAGISKHVTAHTLRHTAATWVRQATGDVRLVAEYLGHSDLSTVSRYAHVASEELHTAAPVLADGSDWHSPPPPPGGARTNDAGAVHPGQLTVWERGCTRSRALLKIAARHGSLPEHFSGRPRRAIP